ncbi:hypothetical protein MLD38_025182 [Melastoma candidum]|uniref:Uncharacterized protein n=1 Tax=Melastoma candidum TaxID=119954 RepID=A0ACB9NUN4_9MYRT|nr:hypothetical protein MLD38_025182 [Melastoma candidum]
MSRQAYIFKICFCFKRIFKLREAEPPGDVKQLFQDYSEDGIMNIDDLLRFMVEFQKEMDATKEDALAIFCTLSFRYFNALMLDPIMSCQDEQSAQQEQDEIEGNVFPEYRHLISIHAGKPKGGVEGHMRIDPTRVRRLS